MESGTMLTLLKKWMSNVNDRAKTPRALSKGAEQLKLHMRVDKIGFTPEYKFHPDRQWRFDFALAKGIAVEVDGGARMAVIGRDGKPYAVGRHAQEGDYEKLNAAALLGWRVLRFTPAQVESGYAIKTIKTALNLD